MIGGEKSDICGGYLQPNTSNNSMKTHPLNRHDGRREKRYVVVTHSLIRTYIKQFNENSPAKA